MCVCGERAQCSCEHEQSKVVLKLYLEVAFEDYL